MPALRNSRQELFARAWFEGKTNEEAAIAAGYSPSRARQTSSRLVTYGNIIARYDELQKKAEDASVANVLERKQILTEIARGNLLDYQAVGADGGYLDIDRDKPNTRAISEITSRTEYDKDGAHAALITKVKLHSSAQAIDLLNKMEKLYTDGVYVDNRTLNIVGDLTDEQLVTIAGRGHSASRSSNGASEAEESSE